MNPCSGAPAEQYALAYIEGSLPEFEMNRFEEHYFECARCLAYLQALQAVGAELAHQPAVQLDEDAQEIQRRNLFAWPKSAWAMGAVAALVVLSVLAFRVLTPGTQQTAAVHSTPAPQTQSAPTVPGHAAQPAFHLSASQATAAQLADLVMPAFVAPNLRGESEDARFLAGMTSYSRGDYRAALATLSQVPASIPESRAARFYSGVCQMHLGDLPGATANLTAVADAGDSPEQEAALYYLAQTSLLANDLAAAHHQLLHTITLKGDLERRARQQDRKVLAQIEASRVAADGANRTAKP